ncbi:MAG: TIGR01212 family radical SAM protein [Bdellovibrionales bacterium RBG_16_40_8]|nr:MAG: TIGR01212 family radical SAM protein [Bdellovibrionales bacterium RBG_16_40_8]
MISQSNWRGLPYHSIGQHYKAIFGEKVYKIPVSVAVTCPNREGFRGMQTCNFCDTWGSSAYPDLQGLELISQIEESRERVLRRINAGKFLVYFQAYTTTFAKVAKLREQIAASLKVDKIVGIVVGTRPDCISDALIDLLREFSEKCYVSVEFGVQSFDENQLIWMRRGHTAKKSMQALFRVSESCPKVNLGIHLMFGLPHETDADAIKAAKICNSLPIDNVKLHNLHVLKNTSLAADFTAGKFVPISLSDYVDRAILFLQHLNPRIAIHRLAALSSRREELIAPKWTSKKMEIYQIFLNTMAERGSYQGQSYKPLVDEVHHAQI